ncbi:ABC transporter ATP-binding protein [Skermanella stibiiresistens SB22]|uniref:ABC transporter ATP-binding protein n=1 Tax=Skermanella stibiiresistens SB22 TaxID=1385369 RepID=W9H6M9_9PROT|nr:ABC transporter ATP-binding protein [Skermanella stibiiresistens]EWY41890.1 ABC transporter ATP-binding protein [Skermanella stibiiresistens SB22]
MTDVCLRRPLQRPSDAAIALTGVGKTFLPSGSEVVALTDIDLTVGDGEFVAIVGSSGCGKSTLLRLIAGLMPVSTGRVEVKGHRVSGPDPGVGIVFQTPVLLPWRTVRRNIELQLDVRRLGRSQHGKEVDRLIALTGLAGFENSMPYELSGGMQQRVALCRALIHNPDLLLMDEPFGALDALTREQMNAELQRIWMETRKTVVFITHSIMEAAFLADRVVVMTPRPGKIREIVPIDLPRPRTFETFRNPVFHEACDRIRSLMSASGLME